MRFRVVLQRLAQDDLQDAYAWAARAAPAEAAKWLDRFEVALQSLNSNPKRCPLARESSKAQIELREYLFGKRPNVFRAIFMIDGTRVRILRIRRAQRRFLTRKEIEEAFKNDL